MECPSFIKLVEWPATLNSVGYLMGKLHGNGILSDVSFGRFVNRWTVVYFALGCSPAKALPVILFSLPRFCSDAFQTSSFSCATCFLSTFSPIYLFQPTSSSASFQPPKEAPLHPIIAPLTPSPSSSNHHAKPHGASSQPIPVSNLPSGRTFIRRYVRHFAPLGLWHARYSIDDVRWHVCVCHPCISRHYAVNSTLQRIQDGGENGKSGTRTFLVSNIYSFIHMILIIRFMCVLVYTRLYELRRTIHENGRTEVNQKKGKISR